jgi:hypothetical protein
LRPRRDQSIEYRPGRDYAYFGCGTVSR